MAKDLSILILLFLSINAFTQAQFQEKKNQLSLHITQLFVHEIQVSYERQIIEKLSIEGTAGVRIPSGNNFYDTEKAPLTNFKDYEENGGYMPIIPFANGYMGSIGIKLNITPHLYLSLNPFFRNNSFDKKYIVFPYDGDDPKILLRSEDQNSYGAKLLFGVRLFKGSHPFLLDIFSGLGVRNNIRKVKDFGEGIYTDRAEDVELYDMIKHSRTNRILPSAHLGVKFGYRF